MGPHGTGGDGRYRQAARQLSDSPGFGRLAPRVQSPGGMSTHAVARIAVTVLIALVALAASPAPAAVSQPHADRILPLDEYRSDKGRALAVKYDRSLRDLNQALYHCMPWVEVQRQSIGFFRPKGAARDERYLAVRIYVEQDPSPVFSRLPFEERASAMFSRYVAPLLLRMARPPALLADPGVDGFTVIVEWLKGLPARGERPVHETMAVFVPRSAAAEYLAGRSSVGRLADTARVLAWNGETPLGRVRVTAWHDDFVSTYKVADYQLAAGVTCG
jgi:hypothetical protein